MTALNETQKTDVRRFCGYGAIGSVVDQGGYRFFLPEGDLEFRINNLTVSETVLITASLVRLNSLEAAFYAVSDNLTVASAGPFTRNAAELKERNNLYRAARLDLCAMLELPPGPGLRGGGIRVVA